MSDFSLTEMKMQLADKLGFSRLEKRERLILYGGIVFVLVFLLAQFVFSPLLQKRTYATGALIRKEANLKQIIQLQKEYRTYQKSAGDLEERIQKRSPLFSLFSFIEKQAAGARLKEQIKYMKPSSSEDGPLLESQVEMSLDAITLADLVKFLSLVESYENCVVVERISIRENGKKEGYLNSVLQIVSYSLNESI